MAHQKEHENRDPGQANRNRQECEGQSLCHSVLTFRFFGLVLATRCCGLAFATCFTACSKRSHASGSTSTVSGFGASPFFLLLGNAMRASIQIGTPPDQRILDEFYRCYGRALASWSSVEGTLAQWFNYACGVTPENYRSIDAVFYSARSFNGSADMLKAAFFADPNRDADLTEFFRCAINRTMGYYGFRNRLAHDQMFHYVKHNQMILAVPTAFGSRRPDITVAHLINAADNFEKLEQIWVYALPSRAWKPLLTPKEALQRIEQLPAEAHSNEPSQKQRNRKRQRQLRPASKRSSPQNP